MKAPRFDIKDANLIVAEVQQFHKQKKLYRIVFIASFLLGAALGASPMPSKGVPIPAGHHKHAAPTIIEGVAAASISAPTSAHKLAKRGGYG